ncbi:hypothetical protein NEF87_004094 [Candidatus Lokiarchaeum ossiferum]|uniref:2-oxoacid dehydrogenase acyltransferase catalytic domain-containing protein n=1 Tax=Candidatus Lokiarchaeum ossiferum TaxID=2951803 RepID=A0ABY6HZ20_9ARCH|nr:hypothetical protein NEF87_004094 [Candidatus Lokiarchaeum sp. B-35]
MDKKWTISPFSLNRQVLSDVYDEFQKKHYMTGLMELDITQARTKLHQYTQKSGEKISFTAWILRCIAKTVEKHPKVNAYRIGRRKLIHFHDVDISVMVEKEIKGKKIPIPVSIKQANTKSTLELSKEIRNAQLTEYEENDQLLYQGKLMKLYPFIPKFIRQRIIRHMISNPMTYFRQGATIIVTSVGMFVKSKGWILGFGGLTTLNIAIGGISKRLTKLEDVIEEREFLNITIHLDHDILDGAPAARFAQELEDLITSGYDIPV